MVQNIINLTDLYAKQWLLIFFNINKRKITTISWNIKEIENPEKTVVTKSRLDRQDNEFV